MALSCVDKKDAWAQGFSGDISGGSAFTIFTFCVLISPCLYLSGDRAVLYVKAKTIAVQQFDKVE